MSSSRRKSTWANLFRNKQTAFAAKQAQAVYEMTSIPELATMCSTAVHLHISCRLPTCRATTALASHSHNPHVPLKRIHYINVASCLASLQACQKNKLACALCTSLGVATVRSSVPSQRSQGLPGCREPRTVDAIRRTAAGSSNKEFVSEPHQGLKCGKVGTARSEVSTQWKNPRL